MIVEKVCGVTLTLPATNMTLSVSHDDKIMSIQLIPCMIHEPVKLNKL